MSYDLDFKPKGKRPSCKAFVDYFEYHGGPFIIEENTSLCSRSLEISFRFDYVGDPKPDGVWATFYINHLRPIFFAEEAATEIAGFVEEFDLRIEDPQCEEVAAEPFNPKRFVQSWEESQHHYIRHM